MLTIFDRDTGTPGAVPVEPVAATNLPRPITASVSRIRLNSKSARRELERPGARTWQRYAWDYYDAIGEIKFAFNLLASIISRVRLYPGLVIDRGEIPRPIEEVVDGLPIPSRSLGHLLDASNLALAAFDTGMGIPEHLRAFSLNRSVAGEMFFIAHNGYHTISVEELVRKGDNYVLRPYRETGGTMGTDIPLPKDVYFSRIWQRHPRWSREPDSTMLGVLDQCEKLMMSDKAIRAIIRSAMNAGLIFIPDGINVPGHDEDDEEALADTLIEAWTGPITDESMATTVVPQILVGGADLGEKIKRIEVGRKIDPELVSEGERALDRTLAGIDIPKDIVNGLSDVKYANAIIIDDNLYRAHVEPTVLAAVDTYTKVFFRPFLRKLGVPETLVRHAVLWYDPSAIIAHPDKAAASDRGYDRGELSGAAWREANGYSEDDAPSDEELLKRRALSPDVPLPPDTAQALMEHFAPETFAEITNTERKAGGMPAEIGQMLDGGTGTPAQAPAPPAPGGELPPAPTGGPDA